MTGPAGETPDTGTLRPETLRILAGGMNLRPHLDDIDHLGPGGRALYAPYCAAGQMQLVNRYSNEALYELTEEGRRVLAAYREVHGPEVAGVLHVGVLARWAPAGAVPVCSTCSAEGALVEWPCPTATAYWPDLPLPAAPPQVAALIEVYERYSPDDTGLYRRLQVWFDGSRGSDLYNAASSHLEHERALLGARARLVEHLDAAQFALTETLVTVHGLVAQADAEYDGTSLGADMERYLPVLIDLTKRLREAAIAAHQ